MHFYNLNHIVNGMIFAIQLASSTHIFPRNSVNIAQINGRVYRRIITDFKTLSSRHWTLGLSQEVVMS